MQKIVSIIILSYNGEKVLKKCLESVLNLNFNKKDLEVILVENNSQDKSLKIAEGYKRIKIIKNKSNLGFAAGNNIGINIAKGKYIVLLNNDATLERNWLKKLIPILEKDKKIGVIGGKIKYKNEKTWFSGAKVYFGGFVRHNYLGDKSGECDYVACAAVILKKSVLEKVGLFDESFFLYGEDAELCMRIKKAGYKIFYNPNAVSYHLIEEKRMSSHEEYYEQRNRVYLYAKNLGFMKIPYLLLDLFFLFPIFWLNRILKNPRKIKFLRESLKARIDSISMVLK
jgi:GT2 family glycosyltransferase